MVFDEVLDKWCMPHEKVHGVVTDNSSNVIRAFKEHVVQAQVQNYMAVQVAGVRHGQGEEGELQGVEEEFEEAWPPINCSV